MHDGALNRFETVIQRSDIWFDVILLLVCPDGAPRMEAQQNGALTSDHALSQLEFNIVGILRGRSKLGHHQCAFLRWKVIAFANRARCVGLGLRASPSSRHIECVLGGKPVWTATSDGSQPQYRDHL